MRLPFKLPKRPFGLTLVGREDGEASLSTGDPETVDALVRSYALLATGEIILIPLPGVDLAAVFLTWARMIQEIGRAYGKDISLEDARKLVWSFLRHGLSAGGAWFGSAALAQMILKAIPGGRVAAYLLDATIAGASIGRITRELAQRTRQHFEAPASEPSEKKKAVWDEAFGRVVAAGQSLAVIVRGIRP
jgi:uncharacterized protein (DUF697 family)